MLYTIALMFAAQGSSKQALGITEITHSNGEGKE